MVQLNRVAIPLSLELVVTVGYETRDESFLHRLAESFRDAGDIHIIFEEKNLGSCGAEFTRLPIPTP